MTALKAVAITLAAANPFLALGAALLIGQILDRWPLV